MNCAVENLMTLEELLHSVAGKLIDGFNGDFIFTSVVTDSRAVVFGSLFIPLIGEKQNGHLYIEQAIQNGAKSVFISKTEYKSNYKKYDELAAKSSGTAFIIVEHTLYALQHAAMHYAAKFPSLIKIGITGSSGKTTTKEMIVSVLSRKYNVVFTEGNLNSETGLPLSVFNIRKEHTAGVFEMGMNRENEIGEIAAVLKPEYAVITNIGTAHIGILGSRENIASEKRKIFDYIPKEGAAFIPADDDFSDFLSQNVRGDIVKYGENISEEISGVRFVKDLGLDGTLFEIDGLSVHLSVPGIYNYRNALAAVSLAKNLGLSAEQIKDGLERFKRISGRMECLKLRLKTGCNITLIKDCYNANPDSMQAAIDFCASLKNTGRKIFVLGDMLELGEKSKVEHEKIGKSAAHQKPYRIIFAGAEMNNAYGAATSAGFTDTDYVDSASEEAIKRIAELICDFAVDGSVVLLKASRGIALERVIPLISDKKTDGETDE